MTDDEGNTGYFIDVGGMLLDGKVLGGGPQPKNLGTPRYESIDAHMGNQLSARSDLQSLGYMASSLYVGSLPWDLRMPPNATFDMMMIAIMEEKRKSTSEQLAPGFPALKKYIDYVLTLRDNQHPDYQYLIGLFDTE